MTEIAHVGGYANSNEVRDARIAFAATVTNLALNVITGNIKINP